jgi:hypothetical protein
MLDEGVPEPSVVLDMFVDPFLSATRRCSVLIIEPNDLGPERLWNVCRQETRSVGDAVIRLAVLTFVL